MKIVVALTLLLSGAFVCVNAIAETGVTVVEVLEMSEARAAAIVPGDVLVRWKLATDHVPSNGDDWQAVSSPLDLLRIETLLLSSLPVRIEMLHADRLRDVTISGGSLGITAGPHQIDRTDTYRDMQRAQGSEKIVLLEALIDSGTVATENMAWLLSELSVAAFKSEQIELGDSALQRAVDALQASTSASDRIRALMYLRAGESLWQGGRYVRADGMLLKAITEFERVAPASVYEELAIAQAQNLRGRVASYAGQFDQASAYSSMALDVQRRVAQKSLAVTETLHTLGNTAFWQGDLDTAERYFLDALEIRGLLAPGSVDHGRSMATLGNVAWRRGALDTAEQYFVNAYEIHSAAQPDSLLAAGQLTMLGHVASNMKNFRKAESYYFQSLTITEKFFPGDETVPNTLMGLGNLARRQFDLDAARNYHTRALKLYEKLGAQQRLTLVLSNLGNVEFDAGRLQEAAEFYRRSLALRTELGTKESLLAPLYFNLGNVLRRERRLSEARLQLRQVLDSFRESAPGSLEVQSTLFALAEVELDDGEIGAAKTYLVESLALAERLAPGTLYEAEPLHRLGKVALAENNPKSARALYFRAIAAFEAQRKLVGGNSDTQRDFTAGFAYFYKDLVDLLISLKEPVEAFDVSERYRSRVLMATVLGRAQDIERPVPSVIQEEWQRTHNNYDAALSALMNSTSSNDADFAEKKSQLDSSRAERDALIDRYRTLYPRRAAFENPAPVSVHQARERLPDNAALLSYLITNDQVFLFVVRPTANDPVLVTALEVDPVTLADDISVFVDLLRLRSPNTELLRTQWQVASDLYSQLIGPVAHLLGSEDRLIVLADGPLHALPFAALTTNIPGADTPHFLIEERALQFAPSLDWLLTTAKHQGSIDGAVAVFADPRLDQALASGPAEITRSGSFPPLPGARSEARAIAELFPSTQSFLGEQATETNAKTLSGKGVSVLHFATHGVLNLERPMESFLLLRSGETSGIHENGLLQAGEIAEQLDLPQALVVLSACSTGSGRVAGGEGIVGLGSAFLYAGASDVVSTLWSVSDDSTGQLMIEFYRAMRRGQSPSDALRAAQVFMILAARDQDRGVNAWLSRLPIFTSGSSHSLNTNHWAAFRLHGQL